MTKNRNSRNEPKFNVIIVCYANRERSVLAEHLLRFLLRKEYPYVEARMSIESAGIMPECYLKMAEEQGKPFRPPYYGKDPSIHVRGFLSAKGIDAVSHQSREMEQEMAHTADLILVVDLVLKDEISSRWPETAAKVLTFKEFTYGKKVESPNIGEYAQLPTNTDQKTGDWRMDDDYAQRWMKDMEKCVVDSLIMFKQYVDSGGTISSLSD